MIMNICILGDIKNEKNLKKFALILTNLKQNIIIPIIDYENTKKNNDSKESYYIFIREKIEESDFILYVSDDRNSFQFIFSMGIIFALKKKFKILKLKDTESIESFQRSIKKDGAMSKQ